MDHALLRKLTRHGLLLGLLLAPLLVLAALRLMPTLDVEVFALTLHVILMTVIAICSLVVAALVARASTLV